MKKALSIIFLGSILFFPILAFGEMPGVVINEIAWMGSPVEGINGKNHWRYEWLELYNPALREVSLKGWSIELLKGDKVFIIPLQGTIGPEGYFIAAASGDIKGVDVNYKTLAGVFANRGQKVVLKDALKNIIDEADWQGGWPAGYNEDKLTMERVDASLSGNITSNWQTSLAVGGSPRTQNSDQIALLKTGEGAPKENGPVLENKNAKPLMIALLLSLVLALSLVFLKKAVVRQPEPEE